MKEQKTISSTLTFVLFFSLIALAVLQTFKLELWNDEAYYWVFSQNLDWGYLDHPPMTALLIKLGTLLFGKNEFGVRFFFIVSFLGSIFTIYKLCNKKDLGLLVMIILSLTALNIGGILAVPDNPLIFFTGLFFVALKKYLEEDNFLNSIFVALISACLIYSKYHSILIIIVAIFSFPQVLKRKSFYGIIALCILLLAPHIYWQIKNDYPSLQYHLFERSMKSYRLDFTLNYLLAQFFITGPLISWMFFYVIYKESANFSGIEKYYRNVFYTFFFFFFAMSFKGKTEANWTAPAMVPAIILLNDYIKHQIKIFVLFKKLFYPALLILFVVKLQMCFNIIPQLSRLRNEWSGNKTWANLIYKKTKNTPVVFLNSYQKPSQFMFYSNGLASSYNNVEGRRNQYEYWNYNEEFRGKPVWFIHGWRDNSWDSIVVPNSENVFLKKIKNYQSFLRFYFIPTNKNIVGKPSQEIEVELNYKNLNSIFPWQLDDKSQYFYMCYQLFKEDKLILSEEEKNPIQQKSSFKIKIKLPGEKGKYFIRYSLNNHNYYPSINSKAYVIKVE
jgi:hypothetical protein